MQLLRALAAVAVLGASPSLAAASPPTPPDCDRPPPPGAKGLRGVDWCNFDVGVWKGSLRDGHSEVHLYADLGKPHDTIATSLRSVDYLDVDGDRRPEALLVIEQTSWFGGGSRSSSGSDVKVYAWRGGKPVVVAELPIGTPVLDVALVGKVLTIVSGPDRATTRFRWDRRKRTLVEVPAPLPAP